MVDEVLEKKNKIFPKFLKYREHVLLVRSFFFISGNFANYPSQNPFQNLQNQAVRCNSSSRLSGRDCGFTLPSLLQDFVTNSLFLPKI